MDKKKLLTASLASVVVLGLAFATSQPSVVKAEEEATAQNDFLADFDKALEGAIAELKKADTQTDPELEKQVQDAITKLNTEAAKQKSQIEEGFKNGLTVEEAEKFIDTVNEKAAEDKEAANKKAEGTTKIESSNGQNAPINEVPEFDLSTLKEGITESKGNQNSRVPEKLPATPASQPEQAPAATPAESPAPASAETAIPAVAGTSKDNTYQAPAAKAEDKKELPNTGGKDNVAVASLGFLGLLLGALPFVKRKN